MSLHFVLLCVLVGGSFAVPQRPFTHSSDVDYTANTPFSTDPHEFVKKFTSGFDHLFTDFFKNAEWIIRQVDTVVRNVLKEGFLGVETWAFDMLGRFEFLSMADGSHFIVPIGGKNDIEKEYKIVSRAVSELLRNLKYMERTDKLIMNVTRKLVSESIENHKNNQGTTPEQLSKTMLNLYIEGLDKEFEHDAVLAVEYKKQKSAAKEYVNRNPTMREPLIKVGKEYRPVNIEEMKAFLEDKDILCEAIVNKMFLKMSVKHFQMIFNTTHHTRYLMARALIQKAESSTYESKVNEVYHKALAQARSHITQETYVVEDVLFSSIESGLASNPALKREIEVLMKQVETSSPYDLGMFHVDFSLL